MQSFLETLKYVLPSSFVFIVDDWDEFNSTVDNEE